MSEAHGAVAGCAMKVGISLPGIKIDTLLALNCHPHSLINRINHKYGGNAKKNIEVLSKQKQLNHKMVWKGAI